MLDAVFTPWVWIALGAAVVAATAWGARRCRSAVRALIVAASLAFFFTPFIPHASVEWSMPWPPAIAWVIFGVSSGRLEVFELLSIAGATIILWVALLAVFRGRKARNA
jgi:hypothetical protein